MSRQDFSIFSLSLSRDPVCYVATRLLFPVLESLLRHRKFCCGVVYLCSAYLCLAAQFVMSQPDFSSLCWNLCPDIEKSVATLFIYVQFISVSRP